MQHLCRCKLEKDGVECLVPSKHKSCGNQNDCIQSENDIKGIHSFFLRQIDGDKIRSSGGRTRQQTETDSKTIDDASENTDQQDIRSNSNAWNQVRKYTGQYNTQTGVQGKFFSDKAETDVDRNGIQDHIDHRVGQSKSQIHLCPALDQQGKSCGTARIQTSGAYKGFDI